MAFQFTKDLETGNSIIDAEHRQLIQAVNDLLTACAQGKGRAQLDEAVSFLANYTKTHFAHEEKLQIQSKYPEYEAHKKWHNNYIRDIDILMAKLKKEGANIVLVGEVNAKASILLSHIKLTDKALAKYMSEHIN